MEPTLKDTNIGRMAAIAKELNRSLSMSIRPLFFIDGQKQALRPLSSSVMVRVNAQKLMFTAAHVMRKDSFRNELSHAAVGVATPGGQLASFKNSEALCSALQKQGQDLDVGIVRLQDETCGSLEDCHFLDEDEWELKHKDNRTGDSFYMLLGYPSSRKLTKICKYQITQHSLCICTYPASAEWHGKLHLPATNHMLLQWNERNVTHSGEPRNIWDVKGMSGGGVFHVSKETGRARLVGIIAEHHRQSRLIVATRIDSFVLLAAAYSQPAVRALLRTKPGNSSGHET
ncbi:MAG: hypothetical protein ACLPWF_24735 [Bryobacteraceae bacterium]